MKAGTNVILERKNLGRRALQAAALFVLFLSVSVGAAVSKSVLIRVKCTDIFPPNIVTDLTAVQRPTQGEIRLFWTAPSDYENPVTATPPAVTSYEIRYATFSVAEVGGSTIAWRAAAALLPAAATPAPSAPGSAGEYATISSLTPVVHYFGLWSFDARGNMSKVAMASATPLGDTVRPALVAGLEAASFPSVSWSTVKMNADGTAFNDFDSYVISRSVSLTGVFTPVASTVMFAPTEDRFSVAAASVTVPIEYLRITARDKSGNESDPALSNILQVTSEGIIGQIALAPNGTVSRAYVPSTLMGELRTTNGDRLLSIKADPAPAVNRDPRTLATYDVGVISSIQVVDKNFTFSRPAMTVSLQYSAPPAGASVGVLWWNGTAWIKVGQAEENDSNGDGVNDTITFRTALPGIYQVRTFQAATELTLDKNNVFPRIFTPNGDGINDVVYFVIENPKGSPIDGKIYDVGGNEVSDIRPAGAGAPTADTLEWNGRDRKGDLVPAGVYIYRIKGEGKKMTGTVVVAK